MNKVQIRCWSGVLETVILTTAIGVGFHTPAWALCMFAIILLGLSTIQNWVITYGEIATKVVAPPRPMDDALRVLLPKDSR